MSQEIFKQEATGFRSPGEDFEEHDLSHELPRYLVPHPSSTFYFWMDQSYEQYHVARGDLLVVDRALDPKADDLLVFSDHGKHRLKKFQPERDGQFWEEKEIFGVVTFVIRPHRYKRFKT